MFIDLAERVARFAESSMIAPILPTSVRTSDLSSDAPAATMSATSLPVSFAALKYLAPVSFS
jgi:hypothetical protein